MRAVEARHESLVVVVVVLKVNIFRKSNVDHIITFSNADLANICNINACSLPESEPSD